MTLRSLTRRPRAAIRNFLRPEDGVVTMELVVLIPFLGATMVTMVALWGGFNIMNSNIKSSSVIIDALSRQPVPITEDFVDQLKTLNDAISGSDGETNIRITVAYGKEQPDGETIKPEFKWSHSVGPDVADNTDLSTVIDRIPNLLKGEEVIILETSADWNPLATIGDESLYTFVEILVSRPRFVAQVEFQSGGSDSDTTGTGI